MSFDRNKYTNEIIIPEYYIVKREILDNFFELAEMIGSLRHIKRPSEVSNKIRVIYILLRGKLPQGRNKQLVDEKMKSLKVIESSVITGEAINLSSAECLKYFVHIQELLDAMGLTQITFEMDNPGNALGS